MYTLRDYQKRSSMIAVDHFRNYNKPFIINIPTGGGKSLIIADICHRLDDNVLILQPTKEILEQNFKKLLSYGINDISIYSASFNSKQIAKYTYATIGSIYKRPQLFEHFKYVIIDECHQVNPKNLGGMYNRFFQAIKPKNICGLTATPYRVVKKYFKEDNDTYYTASLQMINRIYPFFFKKIAYKKNNIDLFRHRYLAPVRYHISNHFDVSNIKTNSTGNDFDEAAMEKFWNDSKLQKLAANIQWFDKKVSHNLIFINSIRKAIMATEMVKKMGLNAEYITGEHNKKDREDILNRFSNGEIKHLFNVGVLTTGYDFPALDGITLARPTMSLALYYQMVGRGIRLDPNNPKKLTRVLDITNNVRRMGKIEQIKIEKEKDGFRDIVTTDVGQVTDIPLFKFKLKSKEAIERAAGATNRNKAKAV